MTPCLDEAYDNLIGTDFNDKLKRKQNLTGSALQGIDTLTALTGCMQPCHSIKYRVKQMASINLENNRDPRGSHLLDSNSSSLIYVIHVPRPTIKQLEEIHSNILHFWCWWNMWSFLGNLFLVHLPNTFVTSFKQTAELIFEELGFILKQIHGNTVCIFNYSIPYPFWYQKV